MKLGSRSLDLSSPMGRSIHYCPECETECFDDIPCSKCGWHPDNPSFHSRIESAVLRRLDCLRQIRELKEEVTRLNKSISDIVADWRKEDISEWCGWAYRLPDAPTTAHDIFLKWEEANPEWVVSGDSIRKRRVKPNVSGEARWRKLQ